MKNTRKKFVGVEELRSYESAFKRLLSELGNIGYIWQGSLTRRMMTCGTKACACHTDENKRHGPYVYWSTKKAGRTVSRLLDADEAELLGEWIENRRELDRITREMVAISEKVAPVLLEARQAAGAGAEPKEGFRGSAKRRTKKRAKST